MKSIRSADEKALAKLLREFRQGAGLTQEQLAETMGLDRLFVVRVENGDQIPSALICRRWSIACKRTPRAFWWHLEFRMARLPR